MNNCTLSEGALYFLKKWPLRRAQGWYLAEPVLSKTSDFEIFPPPGLIPHRWGMSLEAFDLGGLKISVPSWFFQDRIDSMVVKENEK